MCAAKTENLPICNPVNNEPATVAERIKAFARTRRVSVISGAEELEFSGRTIFIQNHSYEYHDSADSLLGSGSYGAVFYGMDLRLHRKHSIYNNTTVGCCSTTPTTTTRCGAAAHVTDASASTFSSAATFGASVSTAVASAKAGGGAVADGGAFCAPRSVAIKQVARTSLKPNELRAMKRVRHPNLVRLIDICEADASTADACDDFGCAPFTYLIMELCDTDLDRHLRNHTQNGCLESNDLKRVIESMACGYLALYEKHIVHRDIKPQNILLIYDSTTAAIASAKITDFGISRIYDAADGGATGGGDAIGVEFETLSNVAGTFYYMAPEVGANLLRISEYDHSADMWSIGCVIYQCLIGQIPFDESAMCRLFLYCAGGNYEAYDVPDIPEHLANARTSALVTRLLEIDREKRATPQELYIHAIAAADKSNGGGDIAADAYIPPNLSFASLSSVLSSSTLDNSSTATMLSSSEGDEMFAKNC